MQRWSSLLGAASLLAGCASLQGYEISYPDALAKAGFPSPVIEVAAGSHHAYLLVDTGAGTHTLARWFVDSAGLKSSPSRVKLRDSTGHLLAVDQVEAGLRLAGTDRSLTGIVADFPAEFAEHELAGLLSPQLLAPPGQSVVLDEVARRMRIESFDEALVETGASRIGEARICAEETAVRNRIYLVPVKVGAEIAMMELDSGANRTALRADSKAARSLSGRAAAGNTVGVTGTQLTSEVATTQVAFAGAATSLPVRIVPGDIAVCEADGLLGQDFLQHCVLVLGEDRIAARCAISAR
jgi:hypothetical protein